MRDIEIRRLCSMISHLFIKDTVREIMNWMNGRRSLGVFSTIPRRLLHDPSASSAVDSWSIPLQRKSFQAWKRKIILSQTALWQFKNFNSKPFFLLTLDAYNLYFNSNLRISLKGLQHCLGVLLNLNSDTAICWTLSLFPPADYFI